MKTENSISKKVQSNLNKAYRITKSDDLSKASILLYTLFLALMIMTSCDHENYEIPDPIQMENSVKDIEILTGDEIPESSHEEGLHEKAMTEISDEKLAKVNLNGELSMSDLEVHSRSRLWYPLTCGYYHSGSTVGETSSATFYPGPDRIYILRLREEKAVEITLSHLTSDHDLFIAKLDTVGSRLRIGATLATSLHTGTDWEMVRVILPPGNYLAIADAYLTAGSYRMQFACSTPTYSMNCENFDNLTASYTTGISDQSTLWRNWSVYANDGKVLHESYSQPSNKVVKFDHSRFGYQNAVRSLTNYHIIGGAYEVSFDAYVPARKKAEFMSEKLSRFGSAGQQGFYIKLDNGRIYIRHAGRATWASYRYPTNRWFKVTMIVYLGEDRIHIRFDDKLMVTVSGSKTIYSATQSVRALWGLDFFTTSSNSLFHIDNFCVSRYSRSGYLIGADEMIDLSN